MTTPQASDIIALYRPRAGLPGATFTELQAAIAAGGAVPVEDEGSVVVAAPTALNFIGLGVTAANNAGVADITIPVVPVQDETVEILANPSAINFAGAGVVVTDVAGVATVTIPQLFVPVEDEGSGVVANASAINFIGAGVTAVDNAGVADVTIPGGGGGGLAGVTALGSSSDQSFVSSSVVAIDTITVALEAGKAYKFAHGGVVENGNATPDFKIGHAFSGTLNQFYQGPSIQITQSQVLADIIVSGFITDMRDVEVTAGGPNMYRLEGIISVNTAGNLTLRGSQNVTDAGNPTILQARSVWLTCIELA